MLKDRRTARVSKRLTAVGADRFLTVAARLLFFKRRDTTEKSSTASPSRMRVSIDARGLSNVGDHDGRVWGRDEEQAGGDGVVGQVQHRAELSATTLWSFVREFSPLEVCAGHRKNVLLGWLREPGGGLAAHWFGPERHVAVPILSAPWHPRRYSRSWLSWRSTRAARRSGTLLHGSPPSGIGGPLAWRT